MKGDAVHTIRALPSAVLLGVAVLVGAMAAFAASTRAAEQPVSEHLSSGEAAFRRAIELDASDPAAAADHYRRALLHFEAIAGEGVRNGKLYYNIGNIHFRLGDIGRAILNYRRAALYIPSDPNLEQNIRYARSRRLDRIEPRQRERVFKTLFFFHYDIPGRYRFAVFLGSFALAWISGASAVIAGHRWMRTAIVVFALLAAVMLASLLVERTSAARRPAGVVMAAEVVARKGDAETFQPSFTEPLHAGTEFNLVEKRSEWWYIELEDGARCWIPASSGELVL
ncbi:MAG: tetratricopeptide repeat protein [Candidatus Krumholzibacteria bacterium]|nr:tetratricopeptide repeat protein [Candidatus Krumholzibacteria bacterium]